MAVEEVVAKLQEGRDVQATCVTLHSAAGGSGLQPGAAGTGVRERSWQHGTGVTLTSRVGHCR